MESPANHWLPLTEYALRSGMSISTLRRKIKSNTIEFRMEEGRYLIRSDENAEAAPFAGFASSDHAPASPRVPAARPLVSPVPSEPKAPHPAALAPPPRPVPTSAVASNELAQLREEMCRLQEEGTLRWRALEARITGLAKKLEMFSEQMAETKMLVKIFEEKLDNRG